MNQAHGKWIVATLLGSIWLSGCGDGGGGATITPSPTGVGYDGPTEPVAMSDQTAAEPIATATIATAINLDLRGTLPALQAAGNSATTRQDIAAITKRMVKRGLSLAATADGDVLAGVTQSNTLNCGVSGTVTITQTATDPASANPGDTYTLVFNNCDDGFGNVTSGSFGMVLLSYAQYSMSVKASYSDFTQASTSSSDYFLLNGGFTMALSYDNATGVETSTISGEALLAEESFGGVVSQEALSQFSLVDSYNLSNGNSTFDRDYTFYSTAIGGSVTVVTTIPFVIDYSYYPSAGQLVITGAGDAKVRVTALSDATNVFIEYDVAPADGVYESNQTVTWSYLASL